MTKRQDLIKAFAGDHSRMAIYHKARKLGLKRDARYSGRRRNEPNWSFWDNWNPDLAYVLGFMYADGYVMNKGGQHGAKMVLGAEDGYILDRIRDLAGGYVRTQPSNDEREMDTRQWVLCGKDVQARLNELGMTTTKPYRNIVPHIPVELRGHFVRGYSDGDGHLMAYPSQKGPKLSLCGGNKEFLISLRELIASSLPDVAEAIRVAPIYKDRGDSYTLVMSRRSILAAVFPWMYEQSMLCLERKKVRALAWIEMLSTGSEKAA